MNKCNGCPDPGLIPTDNVYYSGNYLPNLGIQPNTILTQALVIIDNYLGSFTAPTGLIKSGVNTQTANGNDLSYSFPHTLGAMPDSLSLDPITNQSDYSVTHDATNITVTYSIAPSQGDVISWYWIVTKN